MGLLQIAQRREARQRRGLGCRADERLRHDICRKGTQGDHVRFPSTLTGGEGENRIAVDVCSRNLNSSVRRWAGSWCDDIGERSDYR